MNPLPLLFALPALAFASPQKNAGTAVAPAQGEMRLGMRKTGELTEFGPDHEPRTTDTYILVVGDPGPEDKRYRNRMQSSLPLAFQMDSAQYFHNDDSTWRLYNFRVPDMSDSDANEVGKFLDFLGSPEADEALREPYRRENFGKPGDFVHRNMRVPREDLPAPLNRASDETLKDIVGIFRYNADGTMKLFLREPLDRDGNAQKVYWKLRGELERPQP